MISVIVPVLNEAEKIEPFLRHLQPLRADGHEVIVVDGGSADGTAERSVPYADRVLITSPGRGFQMNAGARVASGGLLLFQHVDTWLPESAIRALTDCLDKPGVCWGRFDVRLSSGHWLFPVISVLMNWRSRLTHIATGDQSIFVSRSLFDRVSGFPDQPLMEDIELSSRLRRIQAPDCLGTRVITSSRRWQKNGVCKTILMMWCFRLAYFIGISPEKLAGVYYPGIQPLADRSVFQLFPKPGDKSGR